VPGSSRSRHVAVARSVVSGMVRERAGLVAAGAAAGLLACLGGAHATFAHGPPIPPELLRVPKGNLIPKGDRESYFSRVTSVSPRVAGLQVRMLGHQELLELTWRGRTPLVVVGGEGEPMFRIGRGGVEVNRHSPSAWRSAERFGRLRVPDYASPRAVPLWEPLAGPGPWRWNEHRAQWMTAKRPAVVGDGGTRRKIHDWTVPVRIGRRPVRISGTLEWVPAAKPRSDGGSQASSPLLWGAFLLAMLGLGAARAVKLRGRPGASAPDP
jgi:hypothetical protein